MIGLVVCFYEGKNIDMLISLRILLTADRFSVVVRVRAMQLECRGFESERPWTICSLLIPGNCLAQECQTEKYL